LSGSISPLPTDAFIYGEWKTAPVNVNYHVELYGHYYSVPYPLMHEAVDVRASVSTVEILHRGQAGGRPRAQRCPGSPMLSTPTPGGDEWLSMGGR
jgi:hypothetical protein